MDLSKGDPGAPHLTACFSHITSSLYAQPWTAIPAVRNGYRSPPLLPNSQPPSPLIPFLSLFISCTAADGDPARNLELYPEDYGAPQPQPGQGQGQGLGARTLNMVRWGARMAVAAGTGIKTGRRAWGSHTEHGENAR